MRVEESSAAARFIRDGGQTGALIRAYDWRSTPLGPIEDWPESLKAVVALVVDSPVPIVTLWGPDGIMIYNDAYSIFAGARHPRLLGSQVREGWPEVADFNDHVMKIVLAGGTLSYKDQELVLHRNGRPEPVWMNLDYSPVPGENGRPAGVIAIVVETTERVLAERRAALETERQRRLFKQAPGFITILRGPDHEFEFVNQAYSKLFGDRDFVGRTAREAFPELAGQEFFDWLDRVYQTGERFVADHVPIVLQRAPGGPMEERFLDFIYEPVTDESGRVTGIFCEGHDVTQARRAQEALRRSERRYRQIVEGAEDFAIVTVDPHGDITSWNAGAERITGYSEAEALGRPGSIIFTPEDRAAGVPEQEMNQAQSDGRALDERWHLRKDGHRFWGSGLTMCLEGGEGGFLKIFRDRTAEHEAEAALRTSEARYRTLFETVEAGFCVVEILVDDAGQPADYRFIEANPAFRSQTGLPEADGRTARELVPNLEPFWVETYGRVALTGEPVRFESGSEAMGRWFDVHALRVGDPETRRVAILFNDISDRRRAEERMRGLNETLAQHVAERTAERNRIWEMSRDLFAIMGFDGRLKAINPAWEAMLGLDQETLLARDFAQQVHPDDHEGVEAMMERLLAGETVIGFEDRLRHADGGWRWISWTLVPEGEVFFAVGRDVTGEKQAAEELERAQEALRQSQKMDAMGQLTGGVAHDFNNLLTPIVGSLDMLQRRGLGGERERRLIDGAMQSAERAKTLVQRLLAFARRQPLQPSAVDVGRIVTGMADLLASTSGPQIRLVVEVPDDLPAAQADPNQLEMALLNLGVNARDAMPDGGTLRITAKAESAGASNPAGLKPGRYVCLSVADTGTGMDEKILARAVEPFFSTKGVGKGTGLGLSMAHGLASQLGGGLTIKSRPGVGTNITIWLPASQAPADAGAEAVEENSGPVAAGTVLLVDDEALVRMSTADMLADLGYSVVEAESAEEALQVLRTGLRPDLLVTDHLMPGMNGTDLARSAQAAQPGLKILIVSGYAESEGVDPDLPRLTKPFRNADLAASLAALDSRIE
ncbi:MAG TPA: PAS domain S-box protein [Allosphingosinicella sp.]|nr:PAS domain S-box protein [Allosphingosinicella sp.]